MPHVGIVGPSQSGKSHLAKRICGEWRRNGIATIVLAARQEPWPCDRLFTDKGEFIRFLKANGAENEARVKRGDKPLRIAAFVDDAGQSTDPHDKDIHWLATDARHGSIRTVFMIQYTAQIPPVIRTNCQFLYLFRCSIGVAKQWYEQFVHSEVVEWAPNLEQYEYLAVSKFGKPERRRVEG